MALKRNMDGKRLIRGTGFYTLSVLISIVIFILLATGIWVVAASLVYSKGHVTAIVGWVLLVVFTIAYFLLRLIRAPFGTKLDEKSLKRSQVIMDGAAAAASVIADPTVLDGSDGDEIPGAKMIVVILLALLSLMTLGFPLLTLYLFGGDLNRFIISPATSKPTFLAELTIAALLMLAWSYAFVNPVNNFIRRLIWGKRYAEMLKKA